MDFIGVPGLMKLKPRRSGKIQLIKMFNDQRFRTGHIFFVTFGFPPVISKKAELNLRVSSRPVILEQDLCSVFQKVPIVLKFKFGYRSKQDEYVQKGNYHTY